MIRLSLAGSIILGFATALAEAQQAPAPGSAGKAYKVAFWFETDRPISSLKYQVYDLAKGEYDEKAAGRWLDAIRAEKQRWSRLQGQASIPKLVETPPGRNNLLRSQPLPGSRVGFDRPSPGAPGGLSNPPTSPIPYPYRSRPL